MASAVAGLVERVSAHGADYGDPSFHRSIYTYIQDKIAPSVPADACPPLPVIVYAIRNILEPTFLLSLIPSLLELLAHLEVVRTTAIDRILDLLRQDNDARLLNEHERAALEARTDPSKLAAQRQVYRKIVHGCCMLHIHHLWRTYNPDKDPPLTTYLIDYFPAFFSDDPDIHPQCLNALETRPWHHALSDAERDDNRRVGAQAAEFMLNAAEYVEAPDKYCNDHGHDLSSPFDDLFPPPDVQQTIVAITFFVERVQRACDTLSSVLTKRANEDEP